MYGISINYTNGTSSFYGNRAASDAKSAIAEVRDILKNLGVLRGHGIKEVVAAAL